MFKVYKVSDLIYFSFVSVVIIGWVLDVFKVIAYFLSDAKIADITALMVGKIVGIFVPIIGGILGWF